MGNLNSEIATDVIAACETQASAIAEALWRALGSEYEVAPAGAVELDEGDLPDQFAGPGMVMTCRVADQTLLLLLTGSGGLLPDWCSDPDDSQQGRLATLALVLGRALLPESCMPSDSKATYVEDLATAFQSIETETQPSFVSLTVTSGSNSETLYLIWPVSHPKSLFVVEEPPEEATLPKDSASSGGSPSGGGADGGGATSANPSTGTIYYRDLEEGITLLPPYARSLLKVRVPVRVTLATTKQAVRRIVELSPGSIINFEKACDDMLTLEVAGQAVAVGEAVKVGDKFGLWITSIAMPEERFWVLRTTGAGARAK